MNKYLFIIYNNILKLLLLLLFSPIYKLGGTGYHPQRGMSQIWLQIRKESSFFK